MSSLTDDVPSEPFCPPTLIYFPTNNTKVIQCDENHCCLTCPHFNNFYADGKLALLSKVLAGIGITGFFLMSFLVLSFVVLPSAKNNPITKKILLPFALSVILFSAADFFNVEPGKTQCVSVLQQSTIRDNKLCAAQAFFELSGGYAVAFWASVLIINLHMLSVWRSDFVMRNINYFHIPIWILTLLAAIVPMVTNQVESGSFCFISKEASPMYFYVLSFIFPVTILHLVTLAYMAKVSNRANRRQKDGRISFSETQVLFLHIRHIIKVQWRAFVGAFFMLFVYVTDVFYFILNSRTVDISRDASWYPVWTDCLIETNGDHAHCSKFAKVSSFGLQVFVLSLNRCVGVVIFLIFAAKRSVFKEWIRLLKGIFKDDPSNLRMGDSRRNGMIVSAKTIGNRNDTERGERHVSREMKNSHGSARISSVRRPLESRGSERTKSQRSRRNETNNVGIRETGSRRTRAAPRRPTAISIVDPASSKQQSIHPPNSPTPILSTPPPTPPPKSPLPPVLSLPPPPTFAPPTSLSPRPRRSNPALHAAATSNSVPINPTINEPEAPASVIPRDKI